MKYATGSYQVRVKWWKVKRAKYLPQAFAKSHSPHPRPMDVIHNFSCGFGKGSPRYWAFATVEQRDRFVQYYVGTEKCEDPYP